MKVKRGRDDQVRKERSTLSAACRAPSCHTVASRRKLFTLITDLISLPQTPRPYPTSRLQGPVRRLNLVTCLLLLQSLSFSSYNTNSSREQPDQSHQFVYTLPSSRELFTFSLAHFNRHGVLPVGSEVEY